MFLLHRAALSSLCLALLAMAQKLTQDQISWTSRQNQEVSFSCKNTDGCYSGYVFWYQKKEREGFTLILYIEQNDCDATKGYGHPQQNDFSATKTDNGCELVINQAKSSHSATYYCACWKSGSWHRYFTVDVKLFGQGTRLYVTEEEPRTPRVGVYQASTADGKGKSTLVCLVTDMHPDLVRISWKAERERGQSNTVEQRDHKSTTSMIQINEEELSQMDYTCSVQHQTGIKTVVIKSRVSFQSVCRVKLASVVYSLMIVKSIVYCCGLSLLLIHTNKRGC
ncbi:immunoglobulin lambda-1 light chain-like [Lampris incognitus]|uniref:immunoglobulin lambda-1 light chain-like n=1 Tax=Lampris incognitus TaxID=2546036 RepID=UPI0024B5AF90|nr:immunoglobulin lambda-1 light chain-like [Lampris incognitus]